MSTFQPKNCKMKKPNKKKLTCSQEKKQSIELESKVLELSGREFYKKRIDMLKTCGKSEQQSVDRWRILAELWKIIWKC